MAAADEAELVHMVATAAAYDDGPIAFRYPRGEGVGVEMPERGVPLAIGRGRVLREGSRIALLSLGTRLAACLKAADELAIRGLSTTVADARFVKPLDVELIERLAREHEVLITVEEGSLGGFGAFVLQHLVGSRIARRQPAGPHDDPARPLPRAGQAGTAPRASRTRRRRHCRESDGLAAAAEGGEGPHSGRGCSRPACPGALKPVGGDLPPAPDAQNQPQHDCPVLACDKLSLHAEAMSMNLYNRWDVEFIIPG